MVKPFHQVHHDVHWSVERTPTWRGDQRNGRFQGSARSHRLKWRIPAPPCYECERHFSRVPKGESAMKSKPRLWLIQSAFQLWLGLPKATFLRFQSPHRPDAARSEPIRLYAKFKLPVRTGCVCQLGVPFRPHLGPNSRRLGSHSLMQINYRREFTFARNENDGFVFFQEGSDHRCPEAL